MPSFKTKVLPIACSVASLCYSSGGFAAGEPASGILEEVIVTARKAEESVQAVPVSVSALSAEALKSQAIFSVADLPSSVPGLVVATNSQGGSPTFSIRAAKADNGTSDTVTAYIGDMPVTTTRAIANMVYDMQSIAVLKGPQGTLFGANSTGGAIIFRPNMPSDQLEGYAELGLGNYNRRSFQGMINVPINDVVQMRLAGEIVDRDEGFQRNLTPTNGNEEMYTEKHKSVRFGLRLQPTASFRNDLLVSFYDQDDQPYQEVPVALRSGFTANGMNVDWALAGISPASNIEDLRLGPSPTWNKAEITDVIDTITYDITDNASFKAVLGYERAKLDTFQDNDGTPLTAVNGRTTWDTEQWTFEPSIDLTSSDGRLHTKVGLYGSKLNKDIGNSYSVLGLPYDPASPAFPFASPSFPVQNNSFYEREFRSSAIYTQLSYDVTDEISATLGVRYTWDEGDYRAQNRLGFGLNSATGITVVGNAIAGDFFSGICSAGLATYNNFNPTACTGEQDIKTSAPSFTLALENKFSDSSMAYATVRGGYLVGGFNNQVFTAAGFGQTFKPEKVIDVEFGLKTDWELMSRPIRTNIAAFYGNYKDQQRTQNGQADGLTFRAVQNAGASTFYGLDFDAIYGLTDNLELRLGWNHLETEYTRFLAALNIPNVTASLDLTGEPMSQAPKDQVTLSVTAKWPLGGSESQISSTLSWYWTDGTTMIDSPTFGCTPNAGGLCTGPSSPALDFTTYDKVEAYDVFNFTTTWKGIMGSGFDANIWVKNVADKEYYTYISNQMLQFGYATYIYAPPRTYGLSVGYSF